eukprot:6204900-Pleurochrysis_carterae.AAC.3
MPQLLRTLSPLQEQPAGHPHVHHTGRCILAFAHTLIERAIRTGKGYRQMTLCMRASVAKMRSLS